MSAAELHDELTAWLRLVQRSNSADDALAEIARQLQVHPTITERREQNDKYKEKRKAIAELDKALLTELSESSIATTFGHTMTSSLQVRSSTSLFSELEIRESNIEAAPGLRFNVGDIELVPLVMVQCPIVRSSTTGYAAQTRACVIRRGNAKELKEGPRRTFAVASLAVQEQLRGDVRLLLEWLSDVIKDEWTHAPLTD